MHSSLSLNKAGESLGLGTTVKVGPVFEGHALEMDSVHWVHALAMICTIMASQKLI